MKLNRRGALGGILGAMVAKPKLEGARFVGNAMPPEPPIGFYGNTVQQAGSADVVKHIRGEIARARMMRTLAPEFFKRRMWNYAKHRASVDPNLAVLGSISENARRVFQLERNYREALEAEERDLLDMLEERLFRDANP